MPGLGMLWQVLLNLKLRVRRIDGATCATCAVTVSTGCSRVARLKWHSFILAVVL